MNDFHLINLNTSKAERATRDDHHYHIFSQDLKHERNEKRCELKLMQIAP